MNQGIMTQNSRTQHSYAKCGHGWQKGTLVICTSMTGKANDEGNTCMKGPSPGCPAESRGSFPAAGAPQELLDHPGLMSWDRLLLYPPASYAGSSACLESQQLMHQQRILMLTQRISEGNQVLLWKPM